MSIFSRTGRQDDTAEHVPAQPPLVARVVNEWWGRLFAMAFGKVPPEDQARLYGAGQTGRDYLWNTFGLALWGVFFPALTVVATQLAGAEDAGMFTMAFTVATLLLYLGNYGVRTYQVSDISEMDSFAAYKIQRVATCLLMLLAGYLYCLMRDYGPQMELIAAGAFGFRAIDALADVYEGRLQQMDKLYLSGISVALRSGLSLALFTLLLLVTRSLPVASIGMAATALATFVLVTLPLTLLETPASRAWQWLEVREIFRECLPSFVATFLFALIETMPKFAMEGALPYENQVYFSAIYFPAQAILMVVGFVYKPQLVRLSSLWADTARRRRFDLIVVAMLGVCAVVTVAGLAFVGLVGIPLDSILYATDFERFRTAQYLMVVAGGLSAAIDFLFQILTVLRKQAAATRLFLAAFVFVTIASVILVRTHGFDGAVWSYGAVMVVLLVLLCVEYLVVRLKS